MSHQTITIEKARELYCVKKNAIRYTSVHGAEVIVFEANDLVVQVNKFKTGRKEAFTQSRNDLIDDLFDFLMDEEDAEIL